MANCCRSQSFADIPYRRGKREERKEKLPIHFVELLIQILSLCKMETRWTTLEYKYYTCVIKRNFCKGYQYALLHQHIWLRQIIPVRSSMSSPLLPENVGVLLNSSNWLGTRWCHRQTLLERKQLFIQDMCWDVNLVEETTVNISIFCLSVAWNPEAIKIATLIKHF